MVAAAPGRRRGWSPSAWSRVAGCQLFYFNAIERMPVGVALLLEYLGRVLVVGWLWLRHGQRPRRLTVAGAAASIAGLVAGARTWPGRPGSTRSG